MNDEHCNCIIIVFRAFSGHAQGGDVYYESNVDGPVSCLLHYQGVNVRASGDNPAAQQVVYGTENGLIGKLSMDADTIRKGWVIGGGGGNNARASRGTVISMTSADVDADGVPEIICGRDDGCVHDASVYHLNRSPMY